jgi:glycosyltransferase involved in cell wall biosynthesis
MDSPLITTIIPTYKRPKLLKRALSSALDQTYPHIQVQVFDNASGDETEEVVREFIKKDGRVKYHCHQQNIGMLANYQFSLSEVKSTYFSFLSDDDVIMPWFYEEALSAFQQFPGCAFFAGSTIIMSEEGRVVCVPLDLWKKQGYLPPPEGLLEMISKYPVPTCVLFHRKFVDAVSIDFSNALTWDCDFLIQIAARYPIFISKRPCGIFLHHQSSYSNAQELKSWEYSLSKMMERLNLNEHLPAEVKMDAIALINEDLKLKTRAFILLSLFSKKFKTAYDYARIFRKNYGLNLEALVFLILIPCCRWFPPGLQGLFLLRKIKRLMNTRSHRFYKQYAKWLNP